MVLKFDKLKSFPKKDSWTATKLTPIYGLGLAHREDGEFDWLIHLTSYNFL